MAASTEAKFIALASEFHEWMRLRYPLSALVAAPVDAGWEVDDLSDETQTQTRALAQRLYDALQPLKHDRDLSTGIDIFERSLKTIIQGHEHRVFERDCRSDDFCIWRETSLRLTARQVYDRGLAEVVRYEADIRKLVAEQMATPDPKGPDATRVMETLSAGGRQPSVGEILRALCPPTLKPVWADVESAITPLVLRLKHLLDPMWGVENVASFVVEQNADKASAGSAACTMRATGDYYVFAADMNRASWTSTTIHEYIHHLQFHVIKPKNNPSELEQAIANLDCWVGSNAMSEGTAVYGEMLARESVEGRGLLKDFTDRLGSLADRLYRAVRRVLEPAIHAGCDATLRTRAGATAYQFQHTSDTWAKLYALGPVSLLTMTAKMQEWADAAVAGVKA